MCKNHVFAMLQESFHEGGWPMYPILVFGLLLLVAAGRYALRPEQRQLPLLRSLGYVNLVGGLLGTTLGVIHTLSWMSVVPLEKVVQTALLGLGESLNNIALSLWMLFLAGILATIGALRAGDDVSTR